MSHSTDILALTSEAAVVVRGGRIVYANSAASRILGEGCVGKSVRAVFGEELAAAQAPAFVAGVPLGGKHYIIRMNRREEEQLFFFSSTEPSPALLNDSFLCSMRNTLMNMSLSADRIRDLAESSGDRVILECVAALTRSCYQLNRLIANTSLILDVSRGLLQASAVELNLSEFYQDLVETAAFFYTGVAFHTDLGSNITIPADPALLSQLLLNLISNCLVHAGGLSRIHITLTDAKESVLLSVSDDGCGIDPSLLPLVFDRYQHNFDASSMNGGTGLGLTAARTVTLLHGGTLLLESRPGSGTSVRASFSRRSPLAAGALRAPRSGDFDCLRAVLTGLSDVIPARSFSERYMD